jgi:hypothetical protein
MNDKKLESGESAAVTPLEGGEQLTSTGKTAMQGEAGINPPQKGSNFENWTRKDLFEGQAQRITIHPEDNPHLDRLGDGVGISKERRFADAYWKEDGSIWEMKSGYPKGGIDQDQLYEYSLMEQAGYVNVRQDGKNVKLPVTSINYLFDTKEGALANQSGEAAFWYLDEKGNVKLLE